MISRDGHGGLYTSYLLFHPPCFGMSGLTTTAHASVLGYLRSPSLCSVWSGLPANTVDYENIRATGQRIVFASAVELPYTYFVLSVQDRHLILNTNRVRPVTKTATILNASGPDLSLPKPIPTPDSFLAPPEAPRRKASSNSTPITAPLSLIAESSAVSPLHGDGVTIDTTPLDTLIAVEVHDDVPPGDTLPGSPAPDPTIDGSCHQDHDPNQCVVDSSAEIAFK